MWQKGDVWKAIGEVWEKVRCVGKSEMSKKKLDVWEKVSKPLNKKRTEVIGYMIFS